MVATPSLSISFSALAAKVEGWDAPSSSTYAIWQPLMPPALLISSMASTSASRTDISEIAIEPVSECSRPTFTVPPSAEESALSAAGAEEPPPQAVMVASSAAQTAPAESLRSRE
ncbi:Uncharacterised protein [uncultured Butyricicoccus sp.]|nr:Uncharacterised protein [uncultured Butyricicoccus sp.]